ncbi:MAG TPA: hypothetical protein VLC95_09490, partial [Anaerolineae bacterium]|nr:hypothetical protein [Anaerolineae bacterium]
AALRSLLRSRLGAWIVVIETLVLAAVLVLFWWTWQVRWPADLSRLPLGELLWSYLQALPIALALAYLLPALVFIVVAVVQSLTAPEGPAPRDVRRAPRNRRPPRKQRRRR